MIEKTEWIQAKDKPVRAGVYETSAINTRAVRYQYWDGSRWGLYTKTPARALAVRKLKSAYQNVQWRGLTSQGGV